MKCRGVGTREELVNKCDIKPVAHVRLLTGQKKKSCTNAALTDSYYVFSYKLKYKSEDWRSFFCGTHAAKHFLQLTGNEPLPLFDPLVADEPRGGGRSDGEQRRQWNVARKQLYNAINMIIICWDITPGSTLTKILSEIENDIDREPSSQQIRAINTVISKDSKNRTLQQMINELRETNKIRKFDFSLLNERLRPECITSYYG